MSNQLKDQTHLNKHKKPKHNTGVGANKENLPLTGSPKERAGNVQKSDTINLPPPTVQAHSNESKTDVKSPESKSPPLGANSNSFESSHSGKIPTSPEKNERKLVLIVEDDAVLRCLLEKALGSNGFDCMFAEHGRAAQEIVKRRQPDVILVDLLMPVMDGLQFIKWLKQEYQNSSPIVVFTTVEDPKIKQKAAALGVEFFLNKPVHPKQLAEKIYELIKKPHPPT